MNLFQSTWGRRVFLPRQRLLWTVWQRCPGLGDGKCPPQSARVLRWTPHTSAPGWALFQAQIAAHTLQCLSGFFQTLQISRKTALSTIQVVFIMRRVTEALSTFTMFEWDSVTICATRSRHLWSSLMRTVSLKLNSNRMRVAHWKQYHYCTLHVKLEPWSLIRNKKKDKT